MTKDQKKLAKTQKPGQKKTPEVEGASNSGIVENAIRIESMNMKETFARLRILIKEDFSIHYK